MGRQSAEDWGIADGYEKPLRWVRRGCGSSKWARSRSGAHEQGITPTLTSPSGRRAETVEDQKEDIGGLRSMPYNCRRIYTAGRLDDKKMPRLFKGIL